MSLSLLYVVKFQKIISYHNMSSISKEQVDILLDMIVDSLDHDSAKDMLLKATDSELGDNSLITDLVEKINKKFTVPSNKWKTWNDVPNEYTENVDSSILQQLISESNWQPKHSDKLLWILLHCDESVSNDLLRDCLSKLANSISQIYDSDLITNLFDKFIVRDCHDLLYKFVDEDTKLIYKAYLEWEMNETLITDNMYLPFIKSFHNNSLWNIKSFQVFFERVCEQQSELYNKVKSYVEENKEFSFLPGYITNL